ncbi:hypothetical protein TNCV_4670821 [Trichonephila clavipes]|nr:hypothetical protein TNCV_4670821 [Trichonephila clavipes]
MCTVTSNRSTVDHKARPQAWCHRHRTWTIKWHRVCSRMPLVQNDSHLIEDCYVKQTCCFAFVAGHTQHGAPARQCQDDCCRANC